MPPEVSARAAPPRELPSPGELCESMAKSEAAKEQGAEDPDDDDDDDDPVDDDSELLP